MLHDFKPSDDGLDKAQRKAEICRLRERLAAQQQSVMAAKLPVVVPFSSVAARLVTAPGSLAVRVTLAVAPSCLSLSCPAWFTVNTL